MHFELLVAVLLVAFSPAQTQKMDGMITQAGGGSALSMPPPIKMGLWEATITNSVATTTLKARSCVTPESYQNAMAHVPPGCTVTNKTQTATSIKGDVSCTLQHGGTTTGHIEVEMPQPTLMRSTIQLNVTAEGKSIPMTMTTESHFVSAECGDLQPGQTRMIP